jgi:hypothetical protein
MNWAIEDEKLILTNMGNAYGALKATGLFRYNKSKMAMEAPLSVAALEALSEVSGGLPGKLVAVRQKLQRREQALQEQRESLTGAPVALCEYPVKAKLMRHQIVGANMAMIRFGECE